MAEQWWRQVDAETGQPVGRPYNQREALRLGGVSYPAQWLADPARRQVLADRGFVFEPYTPPPREAGPAPVPRTVTKLQLVRALRQAGLWGAVKQAIANSGAETKEDWDLSHTIPRNDPLLMGLASALGKTEAEIDDVFRVAAAK